MKGYIYIYNCKHTILTNKPCPVQYSVNNLKMLLNARSLHISQIILYHVSGTKKGVVLKQ